MVRCPLALVLAFGLSVLGCVKEEGKGKDGSVAPAADAGPATTPDATSAIDSTAAPASCRDIRNCVFRCAADQACAGRCVSAAPQAARDLYQQARMCSLQVCDTQEIECRCDQECFIGGSCYQIVDECDEAISDDFCDGPCH